MARKYVLDQMKKEQYNLLVKNGIGWNVNYAPGTFDRPLDDPNKKFKSPKAQKLYEAIMSKVITNVTVEGGKRGGKDVYALYGYANYLMVCPDSLHLVTGNTKSHAINTVLKADGFGLEYLLPHGEQVEEDDRDIFRFIDFYGRLKKVYFFPGAEINDREKFRGMSFGSHYANEAIQQHYNTINEGFQRTSAAKWAKIIHTQNPLAGQFTYYTDYEQPLIATKTEIENDIRPLQDKFKPIYKMQLPKIKAIIEEKVELLKKKYIQQFNFKGFDEVEANETIYKDYFSNKRLLELTLLKEFNQKFHLAEILFEEYYDNPNEVRNGLYYRYFHFTNRDNLAMTDEDRKRIDDSHDKTSLEYRRDILGIRASSDNAIFDTITDDNLIDGPMKTDLPYHTRYLGVDFGMKNAFVIIDSNVDTERTWELTAWNEYRFDGREQKDILPTTEFYVKKIIEILETRYNGKYNCVIVDPSATPLINEMAKNNIRFKKAINDVSVKRPHGVFNSRFKFKNDKSVDSSLTGIWLVRDGFSKNKIKIHKKNCAKGLNECYSYSLDVKELAKGKEVPIKVADHFPDALRYIVNTVIKNSKRWG